MTLGQDKKESISVNNSLNNTCTDLKLGENKGMSASYHFTPISAHTLAHNNNNNNNTNTNTINNNMTHISNINR